MHVMTFKGPNVQATLAKVKAELGDDAVILDTKTVRSGGTRSCQITAALDPAAKVTKLAQSASERDRAVPLLPDENPADWACEWREIKTQLMALVRPQMNMAELTPRQRVAIKYLEREEVDTQVLLSIFLELKAEPNRPILPVLEAAAPTCGFVSKNWPQRFHIFTGPHGVGKTTSLVRLALREKLGNSKARICVVAADEGLGKDRLMLRHYAELSCLAYREAGSAEEMRDVIAESEQFDEIFIDMPGLSGKAVLSDHLANLGLADCMSMAAHLVLAPYFCASQYAEIARRYASPLLKSLIWTKLDEACSFGALLNMARRTKLPVSALSFGSGLKNSIVPAQSDMLWRLIFKHTLPGQQAEAAA